MDPRKGWSWMSSASFKSIKKALTLSTSIVSLGDFTKLVSDCIENGNFFYLPLEKPITHEMNALFLSLSAKIGKIADERNTGL